VAKLCQSCHFDGGPAPGVDTHSSKTTDDGYGNWDLDCWSCHNPHTQEQNVEWGSTYGKYIKKNFGTSFTSRTPTTIKEIDPAEPGPYYPPCSDPPFAGCTSGDGTLREITSDNVEFKGDSEFVDGDGQTADDICQVCHENTSNYGSGAINTHTDYGPDSQPGGNCAGCHLHTEGFKPGAAGQSHETHLHEVNGPQIDCVDCHGANDPPLFADGNNLATTTVCDGCHSPDGAYNGITSTGASIGAKDNWTDGVYTGSDLTAGKERWCVGCHDQGTSVIGGRQAPDVAGNDAQTYGFYVSGHGIEATECGDCHGLKMDHNFDGVQTYDDSELN
jgi:hypothetical protein